MVGYNPLLKRGYTEIINPLLNSWHTPVSCLLCNYTLYWKKKIELPCVPPGCSPPSFRDEDGSFSPPKQGIPIKSMSLGFWLRPPTKQKKPDGYPTGLLGFSPSNLQLPSNPWSPRGPKNAGCFTLSGRECNVIKEKKRMASDQWGGW